MKEKIIPLNIEIPHRDILYKKWFKEENCSYLNLVLTYGVVEKNSIFYRGSSSMSLTYGSWFSPLINNSLLFILEGGYLQIFKTNKDMRLFILNDKKI